VATRRAGDHGIYSLITEDSQERASECPIEGGPALLFGTGLLSACSTSLIYGGRNREFSFFLRLRSRRRAYVSTDALWLSRSLLHVPSHKPIRASMPLQAARIARSALSSEFATRFSSNSRPLRSWLSPSRSMCRSM
jgi:hypothetical protein